MSLRPLPEQGERLEGTLGTVAQCDQGHLGRDTGTTQCRAFASFPAMKFVLAQFRQVLDTVQVAADALGERCVDRRGGCHQHPLGWMGMDGVPILPPPTSRSLSFPPHPLTDHRPNDGNNAHRRKQVSCRRSLHKGDAEAKAPWRTPPPRHPCPPPRPCNPLGILLPPSIPTQGGISAPPPHI